MRHVMIDLETLGTKPGCVILSIGAVEFDPWLPADDCILREFEVNIDAEDAEACGLKVEAKTALWWLAQSERARDAITQALAPKVLPAALRDFSHWFSNTAILGETRLWGHGAGFDPVVLEAAYNVCGIQKPWGFRYVRDTRTLFELADLDYRVGDRSNAHIALDDARAQALYVQMAYSLLNIKDPRKADAGLAF